MPNLDDVWLAGLLEGEGWFGLDLSNGTPGKIARPKISVSMTDKDVIEKVAQIFGSKVYELSAKRPTWSPQWTTTVDGWRALDIMLRIRPYMGVRRGGRIDELWRSEYAQQPRWYRGNVCRNGHQLDTKNLFVDKWGRHCRKCMNSRQRNYRARKRVNS